MPLFFTLEKEIFPRQTKCETSHIEDAFLNEKWIRESRTIVLKIS